MIRPVATSIISGLVIAVLSLWLWVGTSPTSALILGRGWERYGTLSFLAGLSHGLAMAIATVGVAFRAESRRHEAYPVAKEAPVSVKIGIPLLMAAVILATAIFPVALLGLRS